MRHRSRYLISFVLVSLILLSQAWKIGNLQEQVTKTRLLHDDLAHFIHARENVLYDGPARVVQVYSDTEYGTELIVNGNVRIVAWGDPDGD